MPGLPPTGQHLPTPTPGPGKKGNMDSPTASLETCASIQGHPTTV